MRAGLGNGVTDLLELTRAADEGIGPYPDFYVGIGAGVRSHMGLLGP